MNELSRRKEVFKIYLALILLLPIHCLCNPVIQDIDKNSANDKRCGQLCSLEESPVCSMGLTFQNECLAVCQGHSRYKSGPCPNFFDKNSFNSSMLTVNVTDIVRNEEGFYFMGKLRTVRSSEIPKIPILIPEYDKELEDKERTNSSLHINAIKVFTDGSLFVHPLGIHDRIDLRRNRIGEDRKLVVIGKDSRRIVAETTALPFARIGEFDYPRKSEGGCTGAVVGSDYILTAAHCIYDVKGGKFNLPLLFSPGRFQGIDGTMNPFSSWQVDSATTYDAYTISGDSRYDVAIVKLKSNDYGSIGDRVGVLPLKRAPCRFNKQYGVAGYPADKPDGTMWVSQPCSRWSYQCSKSPKRILHQCDTFGGFSGAPLFSSMNDNSIAGIHTHGYPEQYSWNGGVAFDLFHLTNLLQWAGLPSYTDT